MPKEIRFAELVKKSGKPEIVTLWTKPKDNPSLMKAVRENRVLTVFQKPIGPHKDFGVIGFLQEQFALYLVFPKRLPASADVRVIGIKYDLLEEKVKKEPALKTTITPKAEKKQKVVPAVVPKEKPVPLKKFRVRILRNATNEITLTVTADNISHAGEKALLAVKTKIFKPEKVQDEVKEISEV
jgi:hypothetical protein